MKKFLLILLSFVLVLFCVGCGGTYTPPIITPPSDSGEQGGDNPGNPGTEDELVFTVQLVNEDGSMYTPTQLIEARFLAEDGNSMFEAKFNSRGLASAVGPDGEYRVSLSNLPEDYTYNPNDNYTDNDHRNITIEMLHIITPRAGNGSDRYNNRGCYEIDESGTYRAVIEAKGTVMPGSVNDVSGGANDSLMGGKFYEFSPQQPGEYFIESLCDVITNQVNPVLHYYSGSSQWKQYDQTKDGGGRSSTYTKNFNFIVPPAETGNVWTFLITADTLGEYPVYVDFTIKQLSAGIQEPETINIEARGPFLKQEERGNIHYFYEDGLLDSSKVALNPDDGFYHLYDAQTKEYGALVYATLTKPSRYFLNYPGDGGPEPIDDAFLHSNYFHPEWAESGHLHAFSLRFYKTTADGSFYRDYHNFISVYTGYDQTGEQVKPGYCNEDGAHPVNEELKTFLMDYALAADGGRGMFYDGNGLAEDLGMNAGEGSQWLFCCGYYI